MLEKNKPSKLIISAKYENKKRPDGLRQIPEDLTAIFT